MVIEALRDVAASGVVAVDASAQALSATCLSLLATAHLSAGRVVCAAACAWCVVVGGRSGAGLSYVVCILGVVESDTWPLRFATSAEGDLAWFVRHASAVSAFAFLVVGFFSARVRVAAPEPRRSWSPLVVLAASAAAATRATCLAAAATHMDGVLGGALASAAFGGCAIAAAAASFRRHVFVVAAAAVAAASTGCRGRCAGGLPESLVGELSIRDHEGLSSLFDAAMALVGDEAAFGEALVSHPHRGGGGARSEHAYHRARAAADFAGEPVPMLQDLILDLRHKKRELRVAVARLLPSLGAPVIPRRESEACVQIRSPDGATFDRACSAGIGTAWKLRGEADAMFALRRAARTVLASPSGSGVTGYHLNSLFYPPDAFAMWHANVFDVSAYRLYIVHLRGNSTFAYVDDEGDTVRRADYDGVARVFRIDACRRRWHSIHVEPGSTRWSFGFMLPEDVAATLLARR